MVTLTFSYRSTKKEAYLRLRYRHESTSIEVPTEIKVEKAFWDKYRVGSNFKGENKDLQTHIDTETRELKKHVQSEVNKVDTSAIDKKWLIRIVNHFYNPPQTEAKEIIPHSLLGYVDYYIKLRETDFDKRGLAKFAVVQRKLERFEKATGRTFDVKDVDERFKKLFVEYCQSQSYSNNTTARDLKRIKSICKHARIKSVEVSPELDILTMSDTKTPKIYLTFEELEKIKNLNDLPDYLSNARDWLIISCYTGQRVSDFMRFNKSMIRTENGVPLLEFEQVKTKKEMAIPVLPEVTEILDKRNGEFPHQISDQRYNDWIKVVCERAGITQKVKGSTLQNVSQDKDKSEMRLVPGTYPKYKLISSHVGRRSFATNYYGKLPTNFLIGITGHSTEKMFLNYIGKGRKDNAMEAYEHLLNAKK